MSFLLIDHTNRLLVFRSGNSLKGVCLARAVMVATHKIKDITLTYPY